MATTDTDVIIIGAGSTGLLLAQGLQSAGIRFQIFERRDKTFESREWSMSLHWGGEFLNQVLSPTLRAQQKEIDVDPRYDNGKDTGFVMCNGETAEVILNMAGVSPRRVSRTKLRSLLSKELDIQYGKKLSQIEAPEPKDIVTARFEDGTSVTAKIIVGCDGSRSLVREHMIGDKTLSDPVETDYTLFNFPCSYPEDVSRSLRDIHPVFKVAYHPKQNMMYMMAVADASSENPADWRHQTLLSWAGSPKASELATQEARLTRLKELGEAWAHPWSTAAVNVSDDTHIYCDSMGQWDPRTVYKAEDGTWNGNDWHGLLTVAGDAAHTMLPHRGQGLNNALEDASRLVTALTEALKDKTRSLSAAVAAYEKEMVSRGGLEVEVTARQAKGAHNWAMLMQSPMFKHGANKTK